MRLSPTSCLLLAALAAVLQPSATAIAQPYYAGFAGGYHSSTAAEGAQRGMADVVRSQGQRNLDNSQAAINLTQANAQHIQNQVDATNAYWDKKKIYEENTAQARYEENQHRQEVRSRNMLTSITPTELNPTTGAVAWPTLMRDDRFSEYREPLDALFAKQAKEGALSAEDYMQAKDLITQCRAAMTADRGTFPDSLISPSLRFLLKLNRSLDAGLS